MSTQPRFAPTRRTVLRTAAWTAPAVSIAVAAPAYACSGPGCSADLVTTRGVRTQNLKLVDWTIRLTNSGSVLSNVTVTLTEDQVGLVSAITGVPSGWQPVSGSTYAYTGMVAAGASITFSARFKVENNGHALTASFSEGQTFLGAIAFTEV